MNIKTEAIASTILAVIGISIFTWLLITKGIGASSYVILLGMLSLICIVLLGFSRLRELDLKNLKLTLDKIEQAKAEVFAKERDVKNIALQLSKIIAFNAAFSGRMGSDESIKLKKLWYRKRTDELSTIIGVTGEDRKDIFKYYEKFEQVDALGTQEQKEEREKEHKRLMDMIRQDIDG